MVTSESTRRDGVALTEFEPLVEGLAFIPERLPGTEWASARRLLESEGAVILTGWPAEPDSVVRAAAAVLGARLRQLEPVMDQPTEGRMRPLPLHTDGANAFIDIHDRKLRIRDPDADYVLILCHTPAPSGGESLVCDGYRVLERLRQRAPELYEFLTTVDVETGSGSAQPPRVARMVEWTRSGRLVVRSDPWSKPFPRTLHREEHARLLTRYSDFYATLAAHAPSTLLTPGEILILDNYRCPHGLNAHDGYRRTLVLRCKSADAL